VAGIWPPGPRGPGWAETPVHKRADRLRPLKRRILEKAEAIAAIVHQEVGKPEAEALLAEVLPSADVVAYWCEAVEELLDVTEVELDAIAYPSKAASITREARGVVALIQPWNFPVALPLRTLVPALLAGNAVVFKPSEVTPRSGALLGELFDGLLPPGVLTVVQGGGDLGAALVGADVDLVVFTGSVATGRKVAVACAEKLIPCALELGGKDAAIVLADAEMDRAVNGIVWGALGNAGQNCAAIERVYVVEEIAKAFTEKVVAAVKALTPADIGPLATTAQCDIVARHVKAAKEAGNEILCGGEAGEGSHYPATVVRVKDAKTPLVTDETFGPVIPIITVKDAEAAIDRANDSRYGLTASIWSRDTKKATALARKLRAGVVTINNHAFTGAIPMMPWSGVGETGWGVTNSPFALDMLTRPRALLVDKNRGKRELWWYPYTPVLTALAKAMAIFRGGGGIGARIGALFKLLSLVPKRLRGQ
jgi:acyl-CoA reductase-like NAD-dependent aldehyde dehydrogenase